MTLCLHVIQDNSMKDKNVTHYISVINNSLAIILHTFELLFSEQIFNIIVTCYYFSTAGFAHLFLINLYTAGTDFSRQNLTSVDVRF